jgi:hypothetical protein
MSDQLDLLDLWLSTNEMYRHFKQKKTQEALWLEDQRNSPLVAAEMAAMAPGTVQLNIFA